jgi:hypothetical protein
MAGFNFTPPDPQLTAEQLAQLGLAAFRPPNPMSMSGMPSMPMGQAPGFGIGDGARMLSAGLGALKGMGDAAGDGTRTGNDADLGGYNNVKPGGMVDAGGGQMLPNPNGMPYGMNGMRIGPAQGGGVDFLTGLMQKLGLR